MDPATLGTTVSFPKHTSPDGHRWQLSVSGLRMYSQSAAHARHSCLSSGDDTRLYPAGQPSSLYRPVPASRLQLPTTPDPLAHRGVPAADRAHALSALHTAPIGHVAHVPAACEAFGPPARTS